MPQDLPEYNKLNVDSLSSCIATQEVCFSGLFDVIGGVVYDGVLTATLYPVGTLFASMSHPSEPLS